MLTTKGEATRARIMDAAAATVVAKGVTNTSLDDVLSATSTSKSQLFHYFPGGKDELLDEVEEREARRILEDQRPVIDHLDDWEAWESWAGVLKAMYRAKLEGCPVAALGGRTGSGGGERPGTRLHTAWLAALRTGIETMQRRGEIDRGANAEHLAMATLATVQGGATMMQTTQSVVPLDVAVDAALAHLRSFSTAS